MISEFLNHLCKEMPLGEEFDSYDDYWAKRGFVAPALVRAKIASKYIKKGSKILDIGCGGGEVVEYLAKTKAPKRIVGVDISREAIFMLKKKRF